MTYFVYHNNELYAEKISLLELADTVLTPCYVYSKAAIKKAWQTFDKALDAIPHLVCYAVKANPSLAILNTLAKLGSGFDIVSQGELERVLKAGGKPSNIVFSGVGKTAAEIERALQVGIYAFNVESLAELERISFIAKKLTIPAAIFLRINPNIDAKTHPYISTGLKKNKFGIPNETALAAYRLAMQLPFLTVIGITCHIGSQLLEIGPFITAAEKMLALIAQLRKEGINLQMINLGGGIGVRYRHETPLIVQAYADAIIKKLAGQNLKLIIEPGRAIVANAGILLTKVEYIKTTAEKNFAIVDAGMNDLLRPALYNAWHDIVPVKKATDLKNAIYDVVGPVCESSDCLGKDRSLAISVNDLLAIHSAGAYGFSMSSNYNSRPRAAEVMVDDNKFQLIRARENFTDLMRGEIF